MKEERFFYVPDAELHDELPDGEAQHAVRVLRLKAGDEIHLIDGNGHFFLATVTMTSGKHCMYEIKRIEDEEKTWSGHICLAVAPTKMAERIEWLAEKSTEIGFDELALLDCDFSERKKVNKERLERIVVSAAKQSRKAWIPQVDDMVGFKEFVSAPRDGLKYIAHCYGDAKRNDLFDMLEEGDRKQNVTILIGPEGDFSVEEVRLALENGYVPVSLGNSRLRTETAGLYAVMAAQLIARKR